MKYFGKFWNVKYILISFIAKIYKSFLKNMYFFNFMNTCFYLMIYVEKKDYKLWGRFVKQWCKIFSNQADKNVEI